MRCTSLGARVQRPRPRRVGRSRFTTLRLSGKLRSLTLGVATTYKFSCKARSGSNLESDRPFIQLNAKEFDLLEFLMQHPRQVLTRDQILEKVWGYDFMGESNIIEVHVRALRIKLKAGNPTRLIHIIRGVGYVPRSNL